MLFITLSLGVLQWCLNSFISCAWHVPDSMERWRSAISSLARRADRTSMDWCSYGSGFYLTSVLGSFFVPLSIFLLSIKISVFFQLTFVISMLCHLAQSLCVIMRIFLAVTEVGLDASPCATRRRMLSYSRRFGLSSVLNLSRNLSIFISTILLSAGIMISSLLKTLLATYAVVLMLKSYAVVYMFCAEHIHT